MLLQLVTALQQVDPDITAKEIAEAIWLASRIQKATEVSAVNETFSTVASEHDSHVGPVATQQSSVNSLRSQQATTGLHTGPLKKGIGQSLRQSAMPFKSPDASALPGAREIARALRPLKRQASLPIKTILNEVATAQRIAEEHLWIPVLDHASTRWLDVALVVDQGVSMRIWQQTIAEFYHLLVQHGAFRNVRIWHMDTNNPATVQLYVGKDKVTDFYRTSSKREITDISGRRLILVVTDCVSEAWHSGAVVDLFDTWGRYNPITLVQLLPQRLWSRTALGTAMPVRLGVPSPGAPNSRFLIQGARFRDKEPGQSHIAIPIVTLESKPLASWSQALARADNLWVPGFELIIPSQGKKHQWQDNYALYEAAIAFPLSATERLQRFRASASSPARRLSELLAVVPISLPVIRLIQKTVLPESRQVHVAEVFLSGLLQVVSPDSNTLDADSVQYDFVDGVRELLLDVVSPYESCLLLTQISDFIAHNFGLTLNFPALLANPLSSDSSKISIDPSIRPFALMGANALRRFGGDYVALADWLEQNYQTEEKSDEAEMEVLYTETGQGKTISSLLKSLSASRPINPYYDYAAVRDPAMFFGREDELSELYEASYRLQSISIVGLRHTGKSSIFKYMGLPEVQARFEQQFHYQLHQRIFILIDFRDYLDKNREDFFVSVSEQIFAQAHQVADIRLPQENGAVQLSGLLEQIEKAGFHPVLLMDAFDKVTRNPQFDPDFFSFLRSLATRGRVSYVTASTRPLYEISHEQILTSPFFDIFTTCKIGPLTQEAAMRLVTIPAEKAGCPFTPEEVNWILDQAGRHPFFLQVTCRFLFDEKCRGDGSSIDMKHVQERIYSELLPHFTHMWHDLSEEQQKMVKQEVVAHKEGTSQIPELSEPFLFRRYLYEQFNTNQFEITLKDVKDALDNLDDRNVLAHNKLSETHYVLKQYHQEKVPSLQKKGMLVYEFLKSAFERLRAGGVRSDTPLEWRVYNILYYRYFRYHLASEKAAARLGIGSKRQFFREQEKAIQALLKELLEMEAASLNEGI